MRPSVRACLCLLLSAAGCTLRHHERVTPNVYELSEEEHAFSGALAFYAKALISESERGHYAPETLNAFQKAMIRDPDRRRLRAAVVLILTHQNRADEALKLLREYAETHPDDPAAQSDMALASAIVNRPDPAIRFFRRTLALQPADTDTVIECARLLLEQERDTEAAELLMARSDRVDSPERLKTFSLAVSKFSLNNDALTRARRFVDVAARLEPDAIETSRLLNIKARISLRLDDTPAALQAYEASIQRNPTNSASVIPYTLLLSEEKPRKAIKVVSNALALDPARLRYYSLLSRIYLSEEKVQKAVDVFELAEKQVPERTGDPLPPPFFLMMAAALDEFVSPEKAIALLRRARKTHPDSPDILNSLAYSLAVEARDLARAETYIRKALKQEPQNAAFLDTLGWVLFKSGQPDDAMPHLLEAIKQLPDDAEILDHVGDGMLALDRKAEAVDYWEKALEADPDNDAIQSKLDAHRER